MTKSLISFEAQNDMLEIKRYISDDLDNPLAAKRILSGIIKRIHSLERFPLIGASLSSIVGFETEYRFLVCETYLVIYRYHEDTAMIIRVLDGQRDYIKILFGDTLDDGV